MKKDILAHRSFFDDLAKQLGFHPINEVEHWYKVGKHNVVAKKGGQGIIKYYSGSYKRAILTVYPNSGLSISKFDENKSIETHRIFFNSIAHELGFHPTKQSKQWYQVTYNYVASKMGGRSIISAYSGSHRKAILAVYPSVGLALSEFSYFTDNKWKGNITAQREFFDSLAQQLGFHSITDAHRWYDVTYSDIVSKKGGQGIIYHHQGNVSRAIISAYPDIGLDIANFSLRENTNTTTPKFFNGLAKQLGFHPIAEADRWYHITRRDVFAKKGGKQIIKKNGGSLRRAMLSAYPDLDLHLNWKENISFQKNFFDRLAKDKGFNPVVEFERWWSDVSVQDILSRKGGNSIYTLYKNKANALLSVYPNIKPRKMVNPRQPQQKHLYRLLCDLFSPHTIIYNARKEVGLKKCNKSRIAYHELDIWIPTLKLGFEVQDPSHYVSTHYSNEPLYKVQSRDYDKKMAMFENNYTLVEIPCWWDGSVNSLVATIKKLRPDIIPTCETNNYSIPNHPPCDYFDVLAIPHVGELMLASFAPKHAAISGWWMGEKFDGIRACWNPKLQVMYSRVANQLISINSQKLWLGETRQDAYMVEILPTIFLDCEIWAGRGNFAKVKLLNSPSLVAQLPPSLRIIAFDVPSSDFQCIPFENRYSHLLKNLCTTHWYVIIAPRVLNTVDFDMEHYLKCVLDSNGEGLILRKPYSLYVHGRSDFLYKYKSSRDSEAQVLEQVGASYRCKLPNGEIIIAKLANNTLHVNKGDVVSYTLHNNSIYRVREDLLWEDIIQVKMLHANPSSY